MPRLDHIWAVLPVSLTGVAFGLFPLRSWDYWWHVTMGRLAATTGELPESNLFLYTLDADAPSFVQPWLSQRILHHLHESIGLSGVLGVRNALAVLGVAALVWLVRRRRVTWPIASVCVLVASVPFLLVSLEPRSFLFVWPIFIGLVALAQAVRERAWGVRALAAFPIAVALWVNLHGSFVIPMLVLVAMGTASALDRWRAPSDFDPKRVGAWFGALAASVLASGANPWGFEVYAYMQSVASDPVIRATVTEWWPTWPWQPWGAGTLFWAVFPAGLGLLAWRRERVDAGDVFLVLGFGLLAVMQSRAMMWFALAAPLALARSLAQARDEEIEEEPLVARVVNAAILAALVGGALLAQPGSPARPAMVAAAQPVATRSRAPLAWLVERDTPVEAAAWLAEHRVERVFNDTYWSGYLLHALQDPAHPTQMVCVDQRIELPGERVWAECDAVSLGEDGWAARLDRWQVDAVVVHRARSARLVERLDESGAWERVGASEDTVLFRRLEGVQ